MGLLPHTNPRGEVTSDYYKREFFRFNVRLGCEDLELRALLPHLYLPVFLSQRLGYATYGMVSLPVLNPETPINRGFDSYRLMEKHNDLRAMVRAMSFADDRPSFFLLNAGETHYPYTLPGDAPDAWPHISGVHGVFNHVEEAAVRRKPVVSQHQGFDCKQMAELQRRQVRAVEYLVSVLEELFDLVPRNTFITITSDHGELFGENGFFGHGPIQHPKVFEVPFVEGQLR
jgi:arylsulfatase A-like enzyme